MMPLQVDTSELRESLRRAISHYSEVLAQLSAQRPEIDPDCLGQGFTDRGARLADIAGKVHEQTLQQLQERIKHYESVLALTADVESTDEDNATRLGNG